MASEKKSEKKFIDEYTICMYPEWAEKNQRRLSSLPPCGKILYQWLLEACLTQKCKKLVINLKEFQKISLRHRKDNKEYSWRTVKQGFNSLVDQGLITIENQYKYYQFEVIVYSNFNKNK